MCEQNYISPSTSSHIHPATHSHSSHHNQIPQHQPLGSHLHQNHSKSHPHQTPPNSIPLSYQVPPNTHQRPSPHQPLYTQQPRLPHNIPSCSAYNRTVYATHHTPVQSCQVVTGQFVQVQTPDIVYANGVSEPLLRTTHHNADIPRQTPRQVYLADPEQDPHTTYVPVRVRDTGSGEVLHSSRSEFVVHQHDRYRHSNSAGGPISSMQQHPACDNSAKHDSWSTQDVQHLHHMSPLQETGR